MRVASTSAGDFAMTLYRLLPVMTALAGSAASHPLQRTVPVAARRALEQPVPMHARGDFDVKLTPLSTDEPTLGRLSIDKQFHGDLQGTSRGEMLAARGSVEGSAGYVALERVTGTLGGRSGSFV